jgi:hypothetical protein
MKKKFSKILGVGLTIALLSSLMVVAAPVSALSQPVVTFDPGAPGPGTVHDDISVNGTYIIQFDVVEEIPNDGTGTISIRFPTDYDNQIGTFADDEVQVVSTAGFGVANLATDANSTLAAANVSVADLGGDDRWVVTINVDGLTNAIGEGATVRVTLGGRKIINPDTAGDYTLEVQTSEEFIFWVTSAPFTIGAPTIATPPGVVNLYNPDGVIMAEPYTGDSAIADALADAGDGWMIKVGPGEYDGAITINEDVTIEATGTAAETIIDGAVTISFIPFPFGGPTLKGFTLDDAVTVTGDDISIEDCIFDGGLFGPATALTINGAANDVTVSGCSFDEITDGTTLGILIDEGDVTISNCTFTVEEDTQAMTINSTDGGTGGTLVEDCTFTGSSGTGIVIEEDATISGNTFDSLEWAIDADNGTITIDGNTIMNTATASFLTAGIGIDIADGALGEVTVTNNNLTDNELAMEVNAGADNVTVMFNSFAGNTDHIALAFGETLLAANNWWGSADGPAAGTLAPIGPPGTLPGTFITEPVLGSESTGGEVVANRTLLDAEATNGVSVTADVAVGQISVANYDANPQDATPYPALGFWDVYIAAPGAAQEVTARFYSADINADTVAYVWGQLQGAWLECSNQGVNLFGGYVWVTMEEEGDLTPTVPTIQDLSGTVFTLVASEPAPAALEVDLTLPTLGAYDVPLQPVLTWAENAEAVLYEVALAEDPSFEIPEWTYSVDDNFYKVEDTDALKYSTTYYWRVRLLTSEPEVVGSGRSARWSVDAGPWSTGVFTTMAEPVVTAPVEAEPQEPPQVTVEAPQVTVNPPTVTVQPSEGPAIPEYILWIIVVVGAVLVIALIVLIVRTRLVV